MAQTPVYFDFDSLDNIEVATGGSDPSLTTPGVTLNLVTKRGTNQLLGSARALYTEWRRVGLRRRGRRPALEGPPVALGRRRAQLRFLGQTFVTRTGDPSSLRRPSTTGMRS